MGSGDEAFEEWVRLMRFAVEFGMELAGDEEGMFREFDNLDELAVGRVAAESKTGFFKFLAVSVVEFVTMAMAFVDDESAIETGGFGAHDELARLSAEAHGTAFFSDAGLLVEHRDNRVRRVGIKFG